MGRTGRFRLAFLTFAVLALLAAAAWAAAPNRNEPSCAAAGPWLDARCYGARGDGSGDDSTALEKAVRAAIAADTPLLLPHGTYRLFHPLVIDYREVSDTGFRLISMGAVLDGRRISGGPVLQILCSGGTPEAPKGCFYFKEEGTLFVNANTDHYAVVVGRHDFSDAQNSIKIDHLIVNNANRGPRAGGLQLNYVLSSEIFAVGDSAGGAAGIALEQTQISRISGAGSASAKGGAALLIENGYSFANTIAAMDLEVAPTCLVVASRKAVHNTFISPYMACATAIEAIAGDTTQLVNPLFGGNVRKRYAAAVGIEAVP